MSAKVCECVNSFDLITHLCLLGAHLPGFPGGSTWRKSTSSSSCTPFDGITAAGIAAYRTSFELDLPTDVDVPLALKIERTPEINYRSVIYVNGWQFGRFNSKDGPQTIFPVRGAFHLNDIDIDRHLICRFLKAS